MSSPLKNGADHAAGPVVVTWRTTLWLRGSVKVADPICPVGPGIRLQLIDNVALEIDLCQLALLA